MGKKTKIITKNTSPIHQQPAWDRFCLSDRFNIRYGRSNPGGKGDIPVIGSSGIFAWTDQPLITYPTIVIGRKGTAGKPWLIKSPSYPSDTTFFLEPREGSTPDLDFLYYALCHSQPEASDDIIPSLQRHHLEALELPLPPVPEQHAIAAILSKIQAAAETQRKIVAALKELKASTMAKLLREGLHSEPLKQTDIGAIPRSWKVLPIRQVFFVDLGKMLSPVSRQGKNPRPYLRNKNVQWGRLDLSEVFQMDYSTDEFARFSLRPGDILVCEGGEPGRTAIWNGEVADCCYQKAIHRLRVREADLVIPKYYLYWATAAFTIFGTHRPTGTKTTIAHLPKEKLELMEMALPPLSEQHEIVRLLDPIDLQLQIAERQVATYGALFSSTLQLLMTGRKRISKEIKL